MGVLRGRSRAAVWGAGLLAAGAVGGAAVSQLGVASADPSTAAGAPTAFAAHPGPGGPMGMFGQLGKPLYGDVTVQKADGSTAVEHFQNGSAHVSGSTLTVTTGSVTTTYATDSSTKVRKDGRSAALSAVDGDTVWVVALRNADGSYTAQLVHDGRPERGKRNLVMVVGPASVQGGKLVVGSQTFTVDSSTVITKNGKTATLSDLSGDTVQVVGTRNADGTLTAHRVLDPPGAMRGPGEHGWRHGGFGPGGPGGPGGSTGSGTSA